MIPPFLPYEANAATAQRHRADPRSEGRPRSVAPGYIRATDVVNLFVLGYCCVCGNKNGCPCVCNR
jgi:hypothetical protein